MALRSILVGLDGSAYSESAIELAIRWSKRFACSVTAVGIVDEPTIRAARYQPLPPEVMDKLLEREQRSVGRLLDQFTLRCNEAEIVDFHRLMDVGIACKQLVIEAEKFDVLLLGQQTYFRYPTSLSEDGTVEQVIRRSPRPVVAVPKKLRDGQGVVIATDGKPQAARAVEALIATGLFSNTKLWVLSVSKSEDESAEAAQRVVEFLKSHDIESTAVPIVSKKGAVYKVILEESQKLGAELIVMGAYGQSAIQEFFLNSVTQKMRHESPIPIFFYH